MEIKRRRCEDKGIAIQKDFTCDAVRKRSWYEQKSESNLVCSYL